MSYDDSVTGIGIPYDPLATENPDITLAAEERKIGGLGIFMVKKMTESMEYEYSEAGDCTEHVMDLGWS